MTKKEELPHISKRIVELREALNLSQKELGLLAGVTAPAITMWETGKRFPRGKNLKNLAKALGVSESAIMDPNSHDKPTIVSSKSDLILSIQSKLMTMNEAQLEHVDDAIEQILSSDAISFDLNLESPKNKQK